MTGKLQALRHRWFAMSYAWMERFEEKRIGPFRRRLLRGLHGTVLEVGCGTGTNFGYYEWEPIEGLEACEPYPAMLERASDRAAALPEGVRTKVRLTDAPAEALPYPDGHFDAVISSLVLCSVADPVRAIAEMRRVLKPEGELRVFEHVQPLGWKQRAARTIQPVYGFVSGDCRLDRRTEEMLASGGFEVEVWERTGFSPVHPAFLGVGRKVG